MTHAVDDDLIGYDQLAEKIREVIHDYSERPDGEKLVWLDKDGALSQFNHAKELATRIAWKMRKEGLAK